MRRINKVLSVYRKYIFDPPVSQLRLGRIVTMESKGQLDEADDQTIITLLTNDPSQIELDRAAMAEITLRKQQNAHW